MDKKLISLVIPIFREEKIIPELHSRLLILINSNNNIFKYEIIFINDGSDDNSCELLNDICSNDDRFKLLDLSRNFGHQMAITAGIDHSSGDAVVIIDGDLQDPPEIIPNLIEKWIEGNQVVYAVRLKREGETFFKILSANVYYWILNKFSVIDIPRNVGDFRLMDRLVVNELIKLRESSRYIRGLVSWIGFKQCGVLYNRDSRFAGKSNYTLTKMIKLGVDGFINFSEKPLYIASYVGFIISLFSFFWAVIIIYNYYFGSNATVLGWSSIMVAVLFIGGLQMAFIGLIGVYLGRTYSQVRNRPLYIIEKRIGFKDDK